MENLSLGHNIGYVEEETTSKLVRTWIIELIFSAG